MEMKKWQSYTAEEKTALLNHWWYYFGKLMILHKEQEEWENISSRTPDTAWNMAVLNYTQRMTSQPIVMAMRNGALNQLMDMANKVASESKKKSPAVWAQAENGLLSNIVSTYNKPEPPVPFTDEEKIRQVEQLTGIKNSTLLNIDLDEINKQMKNM